MKIIEKIISKGKPAKVGPIVTRDITIKDVLECFYPKRGNEYTYLGYAYYNVKENRTLSKHSEFLLYFFKQVDKVARPFWCPRFILRLLNLFGNDNSIIRVRNRTLHNLFNKITKHIRITDTKWKYDSFRIYGSFTDELEKLAQETCKKLELNDRWGNNLFTDR